VTKHNLLAALCLALAGCAASPPQRTPPPEPAPVPVRPQPPAPSPAPPAAMPQPIPPARSSGAVNGPVLSPGERRRDEGLALDALNKVLVPARGNPVKMRAILGMPSQLDNSVEQYLVDDLARALDDPHFVQQLVANMSDAELVQLQQPPSLAMEIAGSSLGHGMDYGFRSLDGPQQKIFLQSLGAMFAVATPDECRQINSEVHNKDGRGNLLFRVMSRLPAQTQQQLAAVLVLAIAQPHRPSPEPLTPDEQELVKLNIQHYVNTLPAADHDRLLAYFNNHNQQDECWAVNQIILALTSGDDDLVALGVRMFGSYRSSRRGG
jgi:hypothetical protein